MATLYLDTSALVKLYVEEEGRETVFEAVEKAEWVATSTVAYAEARAAFARKVRSGDLPERGRRQAVSDLDVEWRGFVRISVSNLVAYRAGEMAERYDLRGFDAIHLASAARLGEEFSGVRFLACDARLMEAARGTPVRVYGKNEHLRMGRGRPRRDEAGGAARGLRVRPRPAVKAGRSSIIRANRARK